GSGAAPAVPLDRAGASVAGWRRVRAARARYWPVTRGNAVLVGGGEPWFKSDMALAPFAVDGDLGSRTPRRRSPETDGTRIRKPGAHRAFVISGGAKGVADG